MAVENYPGCVVHLPAARAAGIFVSAAMGGEGFEFRMGNTEAWSEGSPEGAEQVRTDLVDITT